MYTTVYKIAREKYFTSIKGNKYDMNTRRKVEIPDDCYYNPLLKQITFFCINAKQTIVAPE
jgi:hypothetical protein